MKGFHSGIVHGKYYIVDMQVFEPSKAKQGTELWIAFQSGWAKKRSESGFKNTHCEHNIDLKSLAQRAHRKSS